MSLMAKRHVTPLQAGSRSAYMTIASFIVNNPVERTLSKRRFGQRVLHNGMRYERRRLTVRYIDNLTEQNIQDYLKH
jgi:hypothetical protein